MEWLPQELSFRILQFVDDTDLPCLMKTSKKLHHLCQDALLHRYRLTQNAFRLETRLSLAQRPTREKLAVQNILRGLSLPEKIRQGRYINHVQLVRAYEAQCRIGRSFLRNSLSRRLQCRPGLRVLLDRNLVPQEIICALYRPPTSSWTETEMNMGQLSRVAVSEEIIERPKVFLAPALIPIMKALKTALQRDKLSRKLQNRPSLEDMRRCGVMKTQHITKPSSIYPSLLPLQLLLLKSFQNISLANSLTHRPSLSYLLDEVGLLKTDATTASMICPGIRGKVQYFEQLGQGSQD
ncbi:hypothetical protein G9A89_014235 [Geosiphon pyriformis]|nr:hypothetical protein G9A89_014235 [Geosiphon pyriformis]